MARIAFVAPPFAGHLAPLRALANELVRRGHRGLLLQRPDVAAAWHGPGLEFVPTSPMPDAPIDAVVARMARLRGPFGLDAVLRDVAASTDRLCRDGPQALRAAGIDLLVADQAEAAGPLLAAHLGVRWLGAATALPLDRADDRPPPWLGWAPADDPASRRRFAQAWRVADRVMRPIDTVLAAHARRLGMPVAPAHAGWTAATTLTQSVPGLDFAGPSTLRTLHLGPWRDGADDDPRALMAVIDAHGQGRPWVFCSLGSLQGSRAALLARIAGACADLGLQAVVAHGGRLARPERAGRWPGTPVVLPWVPQRALLPRCALAIVHGGFNTVMDALAAAVPMVVVPLAFEQPGTAARLRAAGVAEVVPAWRAHRGAIRAAIERVLAGAHRAHAVRLAAQVAAAGGVHAAADRIDAALLGRQSAARGGAPRRPAYD